MRPLYDDGAASATAATRDYVLELDTNGPALLSVFGGKITTYRKLAEKALAKLDIDDPWTAGVALPGGNMPWDGAAPLAQALQKEYPFLDAKWAARIVRTHGTQSRDWLSEAKTAEDLGQAFGAGLTEAEVRWMIANEYARTGDDVMWRRTKLGLRLTADERSALNEWMEKQ